MRNVSPLILAAFLTPFMLVAPAAGQAEQAPVATVAASSAMVDASADSRADSHRLYAVGAGAIVGVVAFNMLTYPFGSVPFVAGALAETPLDIALGSRLIAAVVGGAGALAAHYLYTASPDADGAPQQ